MAAADLAQRRPDGRIEPPLVTSGEDFSAVRALASEQAGRRAYPAAEAVAHLRAALTAAGVAAQRTWA